MRVLLFGTLSPEQERLFDGLHPVRLPPDTYDGYIRQIRQAAPDILVAPLGNTRTAQSKAPTKYLEITAAGAAGVYTPFRPTWGTSSTGETASWFKTARCNRRVERSHCSLLDRRTLARIWQAARDDVGQNHDVPVVAAEFRRLILDFLAPRSRESTLPSPWPGPQT